MEKPELNSADEAFPQSAPPADSGPAAADSGRDLELLAPAGDLAALQAALAAGTDAVYFGLNVLNARRRARNFDQTEFAAAVQTTHEHGAKAYLTLNIDLTERELAQAARLLKLAQEAGVDAVLVRDPALLAMQPEFPALDFHFSTQTCITNSADVAAAARLGATRVVLARELSLSEIHDASAVDGIETEVFVQGALCFSVSGRCMLSSWVGGRSGNRGTCTSTCRVPWSVAGAPAGTPLSMKDLSLAGRLEELRAAGVAAVKIEGRMKTADWVAQAVNLYRRALAGEDVEQLAAQVDALGAYTGRQLTCGYLDGDYGELTGESGRERRGVSAERAAEPDADAEDGSGADEFGAGDGADRDDETGTGQRSRSDRSSYELDIDVLPQGIVCRCHYMGETTEWTMPKTVVHRPHKAVAIGNLLDFLGAQQVQGCELVRGTTNEPAFLMVPRKVNELSTRIAKALQHRQKVHTRLQQMEVPEAVQAMFDSCERHPSNRTPLGQAPDRVRLEADAVEAFLAAVRPEGVIVEGLSADRVKAMRSLCRRVPLIAALPPVFFEADIAPIRELLRICQRTGVTVEVNSWGGWLLAKQSGVRMEGGPFLPVLNSLAARVLGNAGLHSVTLSVEADRRQLETVTDRCPVPCSLIVYGRPALMITRVALPDDFDGQGMVDRRETRVIPRREQGLWVLRPAEPFDLRDEHNDRILVRHLVVDLVGAADPAGEWLDSRGSRDPFRFNYSRTLA
jgi:putative protease